MQATDVAGRSETGLFGLTAYQWKVFLVTWLGWALDSTDFGLFSFVLRPAVTELLGGQASPAQIGTAWRLGVSGPPLSGCFSRRRPLGGCFLACLGSMVPGPRTGLLDPLAITK